MKKSYELLNHPSVFNVHSSNLLNFKNKNKFVINQEDSMVIRDYNFIKLKTNNLTNGSSYINTLNKNKWLVVQLPEIPRE